MKHDTRLPPIFSDGSLCVLEAYAFKEQLTRARVVRRSAGFETRLSPMKTHTLHVRIDGERHSFIEGGDSAGYLPGVRAATLPVITELDPVRVVTIRQIRTKKELTLLWIDERSGNTIAVIGAKIHFDLDGIDVRFAGLDGKELRP